jgi:glycosyltransferase involved in cell wall biosynthesis
MSDTQFSVILPVRNGGSYVKDCVCSILGQTWTGFTLLVLDNNSTDGTPEWISSLGDNRITIYRSNSDLSIEANWRRAVDVPKAAFITFIGHDDVLHPGYLQAMADLVIAEPAATLYQAHFTFIDAAGKKIRACRPMKSRYTVAEFLQGEFLQTVDSMGTGYMMRSLDFDAVGGMTMAYPRLIFADYALWVKLAAKGYLAVSPEILFSGLSKKLPADVK